MSTKSTIIETNDGEHIYFDCVNQFLTENGNIGSELTFEFEAKNADLLIDEHEENFTVNLSKDSELYRFFCRLFKDYNTNNETAIEDVERVACTACSGSGYYCGKSCGACGGSGLE